MAGKRFIVFCLLGIVAFALTVFASSGTEAGTYKAFHGYALTDTTAADANSDTDNTIGIYVPDLNYEDASMWTLTPVDMWSEMGVNIPIGAKMGQLAAVSTVGVGGQACAASMYPSFQMHNASTDPSDVLDSAAMYWLLKDKDEELVPMDGLDDPPYDDDLPDYLEAYPFFLNDFFDPDGAGPQPPLIPKARYAGHVTNVANMNILVQIIVFHPGQLTLVPGITAQMGAEVGSASVVVLNNPISADEAPGAISDFCTPLSTITTLYEPSVASDYGVGGAGIETQHNPSTGAGVMGTGTIISRNYSRSERDADGDGIENDLDPCHYVANSSWDPRAPGGAGTGDEDNDGLPDACDPFPNTFDIDEDNDGYGNKQDICPLNADGESTTNQADGDSALQNDDLGPGPDSIGDACDDSDNDGKEDGTSTGVKGAGNCTDGIDNGDGDGLADELDPQCIAWYDANDADPWGTNPSTGAFSHSMPWSAVCTGGEADADGDGYCDALETSLGSPTNNGAETTCNETDCTDSDNVAPWDLCDDDSDGYINDGCPVSGKRAETGDDCKNETNDDSGTDGDDQNRFNDGCPVIGVPESLVIDIQIYADTDGDTATDDYVAQSCNDGVDNDGDGDTDDDTEDQSLGCNPNHASYATDPDHDGNNSDNCPSVWNPEQTNYDGDAAGDACDADDDDDGHPDVCEWLGGTDPLDDTSTPTPNTDGHHMADVCDDDDDDDTWDDADEVPGGGGAGAGDATGSDPLDDTSTPEVCDGIDNDGNEGIDEGFPDGDTDGTADCVDPDVDSDSDGTYNDTDTDCDDDTDGTDFTNAQENFMGTNPCVKCAAGGADNDPYDTNQSGAAINVLDLFTFVNAGALGGNVSDDNALGNYDNRLDLNQTETINVLDLFVFVNKGVIGQTCPY